MPKSVVPSEPDGLARGLAGVAVAGLAANILSYLLLLVAARQLGSADYSELVALLNLLLIGSVPSFALQAVTARRVATMTGRGLLEASAAIGVGAALLLAALTPMMVAFLHLPGPVGPLLIAAALPGTAIQGMCQGVWQGRQRFAGLALTTFGGIVGRSGAGLIGLFLGGSATVTASAIAIGVTAAALSCVVRLPDVRHRASAAAMKIGPLIIECGHAAHAYGVFLLLSVTDVLLARHVLSTSEAAVYAAGSVLTKAALWLPQSAANVLFASLTDTDRHRRLFARAVSGVAALGCVVTAGSWLLAGLVTTVVTGNRYPSLRADVWLFALLGGCLAVLQFVLVAGLAVRSTIVAALIWLTIAAEAIGILAVGDHATVRLVVTIACIVNLIAATIAVLLRLGAGEHPSKT